MTIVRNPEHELLHLSVDWQEVGRHVEPGTGVPHHGVADVDQVGVDGLEVGHHAGQLVQETPGPDVAVDDVRVVIDAVGVQAVDELLE